MFKRLLCLLLASLVALPVFAAQDDAAGTEETSDYFSAVWVSTIYNLDYPAAPTTDADALRQQADAIIADVREMGLTAIFLQVRPSADSLFPSDYFPWSRHLTGTQGTAPSDGFDPLAYWVEQAHANGIELHAWVNPYRVTRSGASELATLSASHPAKQHPEYIVEYEGNYYFDPGLPQVQQLVIDSVMEIVEKYDVDGIHFDDYFYPGQEFADDASYAQYGSGDRGDWRRENVNTLVRQLDEAIHAAKPDVSFGISPFGVWANSSSLPEGSDTRATQSYFDHYADTRKWVQEGWVDYICPQLYWEIGHSLADYETLANWWSGVCEGTGVKLYVGLPSYRSAEATSPSDVWYGTAALEAQLALNDTLPVITGEVYFRYGLIDDVDGLAELITQRCQQKLTAEPDPAPFKLPRSRRENRHFQ